MYKPVTAVEAMPDYRLKLTFASEEVRIYNFKLNLSRKLFLELKNEWLFQTVSVSFDTISWANGSDIAPEALYFESIPIEEYEAKTGQTL